jgi:nucleotide-binding universal stress UspA family protein
MLTEKVETAFANKMTFTPARTVVIPINDSEESKNTVDYTLNSNLVNEKDKVILINCRKSAAKEYDGMALLEFDEGFLNKVDNLYHLKSQKVLREAMDKFELRKIHVDPVILEGEAEEAIERKIDDLKPDFVVIGTRGLNIFKRMLFGSVSDHLAHNLKVPLMVIPAGYVNRY